ncbi:murein L,D-transpeptidase [Psychrobacter frigidicola]|uniref:Murein L,D-transpeptidase n=1 Tax=Psychrobacter frigidicola TaxID=45611 RepID=A0A5C7A9Z2_9GAMM|nr:L,D-transpeptidase [Psychrobacter frigidicola]TXD97603.1 murein L,D-transpeptidase [Psychrobacter frigidicola]
MRQLTKISTAIGMVGLSSVLFMGHSVADTSANIPAKTPDRMAKSIQSLTAVADLSATVTNQDGSNDADENGSTTEGMPNRAVNNSNEVNVKPDKLSQQLTGTNKSVPLLNKLLPTIQYNTENLPKAAQQVNAANWTVGAKIDRTIGTKLQALLNWQHSGVGPVDGYWGKNTLKAMQAFQKAQGLPITNTLNMETWQALTKDSKLNMQPVLANYILSDNDVYIKTTTIPASAAEKAKLDGMYYESVLEGLAEKFHMSESYLKSLNPKATFNTGDIITVYNPGNPNTKSVSRVVADKTTQTLYAYDDENNLVASYPSTVGSIATPSPTGTHTVKVKVHEPNYTYTNEDGSKLIIPPGPNNPVGAVWIGLSEPTYGIHGSPDPARISRQASAGCVRLTNWDALALLGTITNDATVEFQ